MNDANDMSHPLEKVFDLDPVAWQSPSARSVSEREKALIDPTSGEVVQRSADPDGVALEKEERLEDLHIDGQLESVHMAAMDAYEKQTRMTEEVDPRFAARNAEVAAQYLTIALNATNSRVDAKFKRQKIRIAKADAGTGSTTVTNSNVIIADRNAILRTLLDQAKNGNDKDPIDV